MNSSGNLKLYRKRIIPSEIIELKDDIIFECNPEYIITTWKTLKPKKEFDHGSSCYFLDHGIKVSKFYREDGSLLYWYCDIVDFSYDAERDSLTVTDLLADVIVYPTGRIKVMDLDELAYALEHGLITQEQTAACLHRLDDLLGMIDRDKFDRLGAYLDDRGL